MKIEKTQSFDRTLKAFVLPVAAVAFVGYTLWTLASSGLVPSKYSIAGVVAYVLWAALSLFLLAVKPRTRLRTVIARVCGVVLMLLVVVGSAVGLYMFSKGLSTLDKLSSSQNAVTINTNRPFNILISGIDTYGEISAQSRSDVNIVATVNPATHKILLTTAPRDSYVPIALGGNNGMDKLTHAGIYGPEASVKTMANLLNTDIEAYIRINFTSFIESIDTLGGITIDNPTAFTKDGVEFPVGQQELNGKNALLYSRERKSLAAGDIDRGKNQQRVIQAIVDKMSNIRSLAEFEAVLSLIGTSIDTNMSQTTIRSLVSAQLDNPTGWTTESITLAGKGQTGLPSHAMPGAKLYMYVLDESSVNAAAHRIAEIMKSGQ